MYKTYKEIRKELKAEYEKQTAENIEYIENGFLKRWGGEYDFSDDGIKRYSTATRWEQYQDGTITREKAVELAAKREQKNIDKNYMEKLDILDDVERAELPTNINICVEWKKSRTWGSNPTAEIWADDGAGYTKGSAGGCGYDKESAAIAKAAYNRASIIKILCELKEKALRKDRAVDKSKSVCTGIDNRNAVGYGSGCSVIPRFEGGCGTSCFLSIFRSAGYKVTEQHGKMSDFYIITK